MRRLPGISKLPEGIIEYPNGFHQVLDVPGEDFRLCGFSRYPCATPALGSSSALGAGRSMVLLALVGLLVHGLVMRCVVILCLIACKRGASRSQGDTSRVCAKGTLILKSISGTDEQAEKQSVCHGFGYSSDPDGSYSEWSRWVDMLRAYGGECLHQGRSKDKYNNREWMSGVRWCKVVGVACCAAVLLSVGTGRRGRNSTGPTTQAKDQQYIRGGGRSTRFSGKNPQLVCLVWSDIHGHRLFSTDRENRSICSCAACLLVNKWSSDVE
ncbi:hypothetical protein TIFTF001_029626 [Ficus carica]|uniref:Uncharacterized protein n=1 Tax=Ficus carica TaxID=3494 RepID=A0AA88J3N0_FICCA|nr:hypothetical protein TIFTF001_029626 [Ficus carica]